MPLRHITSHQSSPLASMDVCNGMSPISNLSPKASAYFAKTFCFWPQLKNIYIFVSYLTNKLLKNYGYQIDTAPFQGKVVKSYK